MARARIPWPVVCGYMLHVTVGKGFLMRATGMSRYSCYSHRVHHTVMSSYANLGIYEVKQMATRAPRCTRLDRNGERALGLLRNVSHLIMVIIAAVFCAKTTI